MPFFKFGSPVMSSGSAANLIVLDHTPQELATLVAQSDDKARRALREINDQFHLEEEEGIDKDKAKQQAGS
jgi:hypothetical protein